MRGEPCMVVSTEAAIWDAEYTIVCGDARMRLQQQLQTVIKTEVAVAIMLAKKPPNA